MITLSKPRKKLRQTKTVPEWRRYFDRAARKREHHAKIGANNPWGPLARYRTAINLLLPTDRRILDIGCGPAGFARVDHFNRRVIGIDLSAGMARQAAEHHPAVLGSADRLPFRDRTFDAAIALEVIQCCGIDAATLVTEMARVSDTIIITGLSDRRAKKNRVNVYHDPNEILRIVGQAMGDAAARWGAVKYREDEVWSENWNKTDNGTFYILARRIRGYV